MKLFSRLVAFVFGGVSVADYAEHVSGARTVSQEEKLDLVLQQLSKLANHIDREEERNEELTDRLTAITARADALEKLVQELLTERNLPAEEPAPVAATLETLVEEAMPVATEPEPETVPAEPTTPTVEPTAVEEAAATPTEVVEVTAAKPPTTPKVVELVKQWFKTDREGRTWHLDQMKGGVRLALQEDGVCSFPSCSEKCSGAHVDMRDGHGTFPVCRYGHGAAITFKHAHRRTKGLRIQYWANDEQLARFKEELAERQKNEEVERLASQITARKRAETDAAAAAEKKRDDLHHMEVLILKDRFEAKEGSSCFVPNCQEPAPIWRLYLGRDDTKRRLLCNAHGQAAEELRKEQKRKVRRFRLDFWIFSSRIYENLFIERQANRRADDEVVRRDQEERQQEWRERRELAPEVAAEQATKRQLRNEFRGRESHTRIKAVPSTEDKKRGDPQAAA